jgi:hypothetical protein
MEAEHTAFQHALTAARARLWLRVRQDIDALRQLVDESQQLMDAARAGGHSRAIGAPLPGTERETSA